MSMSPVVLSVILLVCCARAAVAQNKCDGIATGAKVQYQWMYKMNDPSKANLAAIDAAVAKWMKEDCPEALAHAHGPTISSAPATFGFTTVLPTQSFADYAAWSQWPSVDAMRNCLQKGLKSGNVPAIRKFAKAATRLVIPLTPGMGSTTTTCPAATSYAPATVRYMYHYILNKPGPDTCKTAVSTQAQITAAGGMFVRYGNGCDQVTDDSKVFGPTVTNTADYGGFLDFKNAADMTAYLSSKSPAVTAPRAVLRSLAASSFRGAIMMGTPATSGGRRLKQE